MSAQMAMVVTGIANIAGTAENQRRAGADLPVSPLASFGLQLHMFGQAQMQDDQQVKQLRSKPPPMDLLIVACSPNGHELGQVNAEAHELHQKMPNSAYKTASTDAEFAEQLGTVPTKRLIFSGHTDAQLNYGRRTLCFTSEAGGLSVADPSTLRDIFSGIARRGDLELVFLNGCESLQLGEELVAAGVPYVVCWESSVEDTPAKAFSVGFFEAVQQSINQGTPPDYNAAFDLAKAKVSTTLKCPGLLANGTRSDSVPRYEFRAPVLQRRHDGVVDDVSASAADYCRLLPPTTAGGPERRVPPLAAGVPRILRAP